MFLYLHFSIFISEYRIVFLQKKEQNLFHSLPFSCLLQA